MRVVLGSKDLYLYADYFITNMFDLICHHFDAGLIFLIEIFLEIKFLTISTKNMIFVRVKLIFNTIVL